MNMSATDFFNDMTSISDFIFDVFTSLWDVMMSNWLLMLSFAIFILALLISIFRYIKNKRH